MAISSNATGLRPGVCTSTTRPTTPYTGQIIYETDTGYLRVWDGAAWDYLSQSQDTNRGLPAGNKMGLELIASGSFGNAASFDITGFTTSYVTFKIIVNAYRYSGTGGTNMTAHFRTATTGYNSTGYYGGTWYVNYLAASGAVEARNNAGDFYLCQVYDNGRTTNIEMNATYMNTAGYGVNVTWQAYNHNRVGLEVAGYEFYNGSLALVDRIRVASAVNISGDWRLYGYREP